MLGRLKRLWAWMGSSPAQWEDERAERHRLGNELVRQWEVRQLHPRTADKEEA